MKTLALALILVLSIPIVYEPLATARLLIAEAAARLVITHIGRPLFMDLEAER